LKRTAWLCSGREIILIAWQVHIQQHKLGEKFLYIFKLLLTWLVSSNCNVYDEMEIVSCDWILYVFVYELQGTNEAIPCHAGLTLSTPGDLAISLGTSDTARLLILVELSS